MNRSLTQCPVCSGPLHVTELGCETCDTRVRSRFERCAFCSLSPEQLQFVEIFLRSRGNLSGVGEELQISYPTVVRRLDAVLAALGRGKEGQPGGALAVGAAIPTADPAAEEQRNLSRREILELLDRGDISAEEATHKLKEL